MGFWAYLTPPVYDALRGVCGGECSSKYVDFEQPACSSMKTWAVGKIIFLRAALPDVSVPHHLARQASLVHHSAPPGALTHDHYSCICFTFQEANHFAYLQHTSPATALQNCAKSKLPRTGQSAGVHVSAKPWSMVYFLAHRSAININTQPCDYHPSEHHPMEASKINIYAQCSSICGRLIISYTASFGLSAPSKTCKGTQKMVRMYTAITLLR